MLDGVIVAIGCLWLDDLAAGFGCDFICVASLGCTLLLTNWLLD